MQVCSVCLEQLAKYTCPACGSRTCSAECVKRHKLRTECTGLVDPAKFVEFGKLKQQPSLVQRDYNYLMGVTREITVRNEELKLRHRGLKRPFNGNGHPGKRLRANTLDKRTALVQRRFPQAQLLIKRQNTMVVKLPPTFHRAVVNRTSYDKNAAAFVWTVEWVPIDDKGVELQRFTSYRIQEGLTLKEALPDKVSEFGEAHFYLDNCISMNLKTKSLIALDATKPLCEVLKDKIVLEFPKIYVAASAETLQPFVELPETAYLLESDSSESELESLESSDSSDEAPEEEKIEKGTDAERPDVEIRSPNADCDYDPESLLEEARKMELSKAPEALNDSDYDPELV